MSVFLNKLVMNVVSFPTYVNVAHLCVCVCVLFLFFQFWVAWFLWSYWEGVVVQNVVDGIFFLLVFVC